MISAICHVPVVKKRLYVAREPTLALNPSLHTPTPHTSMRTIQGFEVQTKGSLLILDLCGARWWWLDLLRCKLCDRISKVMIKQTEAHS